MTVIPAAFAGGDAPPWLHALVNAPLPAHTDKTDAALLYSERSITVLSADKIRVQVRKAYKILRPGGRDYGVVSVSFNSHSRVTSLRGWCIPAEGKDYEVKDKETMEVSLPKVEGSELVSDVKVKLLRIPASDPGNVIGYEYEKEDLPMALQDVWYFQEESPGRESHYSLQLPAGWEYKSFWINYPEAQPAAAAGNQWQWTVGEVKGIRKESNMPPVSGVAGQMVVSFFPSSGASNKFSTWEEMGSWYRDLTNGRRDATPEIRKVVMDRTASAATAVDKMRMAARFVQNEVRYVAIELGIGGIQPHAASEVFAHRYGDCKDKATLMNVMLHELGIESYYVVINSERGAVRSNTPPHIGAFDHVIVAIRLPAGTDDPSLAATVQHVKLGRLLFLDPTDELTPFGQVSGSLQASWGLLVGPDGGELVQVPEQPPTMNGIRRKATLTLDSSGILKGEVHEIRVGDRAWSQRWMLRNVTSSKDRIKSIESLLADSLSTFQVTRASVLNEHQTDQPFGFDYAFEASNYASNAGNLLLVRPRVLGTKASGLLETREPRVFDIEFDGPVRDSDIFEITLPDGYEVEELPPPVSAEFSFANYQSHSEVKGNVIRYERTFEVKELNVPVSKAEDLKKFYRIIAGDERNTVILRPVSR